MDTKKQKQEQRVYTPPKVTTYTDKEILEALGPAQAMASGACGKGAKGC